MPGILRCVEGQWSKVHLFIRTRCLFCPKQRKHICTIAGSIWLALNYYVFFSPLVVFNFSQPFLPETKETHWYHCWFHLVGYQLLRFFKSTCRFQFQVEAGARKEEALAITQGRRVMSVCRNTQGVRCSTYFIVPCSFVSLCRLGYMQEEAEQLLDQPCITVRYILTRTSCTSS